MVNRLRCNKIRDFWLRQPRPLLCMYCSKQVSRELPANHGLRATIEHIIPLIKGGSNRRENLGVSCRRCNNQREHAMRKADETADVPGDS